MKFAPLAIAQCAALAFLVKNMDPNWITVPVFAILLFGISYCTFRAVNVED